MTSSLFLTYPPYIFPTYLITPVSPPSNFWELILSYAYSLQYNIAWWVDSFFGEWPYPWYWLYLWTFGKIILGIIIYSMVYSILYYFFSRKISQSSFSKRLKYNGWINFLIRLIPFGYVITSLHTISFERSFKMGLLYEAIYTISTGVIYFIIYTIHYSYFL